MSGINIDHDLINTMKQMMIKTVFQIHEVKTDFEKTGVCELPSFELLKEQLESIHQISVEIKRVMMSVVINSCDALENYKVVDDKLADLLSHITNDIFN